MKNKIKELRKSRKLGQEELVEILGVTRQTIIAIENNKYDPTLELAMMITEYFEMSVNEIFSIEIEFETEVV
jgi:putative transcriptional regulator